MSEPNRNPRRTWADEPGWRNAVEIDLQAATALARASTTALLSLSALSHREIRDALDHEVEALEQQGDPTALAAANLVRQVIPKGAR